MIKCLPDRSHGFPPIPKNLSHDQALLLDRLLGIRWRLNLLARKIAGEGFDDVDGERASELIFEIDARILWMLDLSLRYKKTPHVNSLLKKFFPYVNPELGFWIEC